MACSKTAGECGRKIKLCGRCQSVSYCGSKCKKGNWKAHKKECRKLVRAMAARQAEPAQILESSAGAPPQTDPAVQSIASGAGGLESSAGAPSAEEEAGAIKTSHSGVGEMPDSVAAGWLGDCPLCCDPMRDRTATIGACCGQYICTPCIQKHVASSPGRPNCPLCRHPYPLSTAEVVAVVTRAVESGRSWA